MGKKVKTEHSGAKNGGGFWGRREEAKVTSNTQRRHDDKDLSKKEVEEHELQKEDSKKK